MWWKKKQYVYNTETLRYEKVKKSWKEVAIQTLALLCAILLASFVIVVAAFNFIDSPKERLLKAELDDVKFQYEKMNDELDLYSSVMDDLQERDENTYRVIFEADPMPRNIGIGGSRARYEEFEQLDNRGVLTNTQHKLDSLRAKIAVQSKSYDEISELIKNREDMLTSIPAIQPIANKDLKRLASGYGMRIDPIYKTRKMHWGLDFTAPTGTPIYSTGKGKVIKVAESKRGYGHHIIIDHGYNYRTLYAHLSEIDVKKGDEISRGQVIGKVGNTGKSTGPHLHYEVHKIEMTKKGDKKVVKVNPAYYFYNDLSPEEFDEMLKIASRSNQSFD